MNDFTKEDLQIIHLDMTIYAEKTKLLKESPSHKSLRDKVEAMIENYCNHEERTYHRKTGQRICPHCDNYFADNGEDVENRLGRYLNDN